jgi:hypothetical protein
MVEHNSDANRKGRPLIENPTAIDVFPLDNDYIIAVGTTDADSAEITEITV